MKLMRRVIVALLAVAMAASSLVACGKDNGTGKDELVTLDCYSQLANFQGKQGGWFGALLKEEFNVELNIIKESDNTFATRMESGNLGDIVVFGNSGENYLAAVKAGLLLDWNSYDLLTNYGSYIKEHMPAALANNAKISGDKGITYGIGHSVALNSEDHDEFFYSWDLRYDYYAELEYPEIKDLDDLFDVFVQMKEKHPTDDNGKETYAVSIWPDWDGNMVMYPKSLATAYYGYDEFAIGLYNNETGEFYDPLMVKDDGTYGPYLEMLQYFNRLYQAGLLDPDSGTQKYDDALAKVKSGRTFWSIFNYAGSAAYNTEANTSAGKGMYPVTPEEATPCVYGLNPNGGNRIWTIGAKTKYPEKCMQILNYLCTPEGFLNSEYGPKGLCWYYDDNGLTCFTELGKKCQADTSTMMESDDPKFEVYTGAKFKDGQQQINNLTWARNATNPDNNEKFNYKYWASNQTEAVKDSADADWREHTGCDTADQYLNSRKLADGSPAYSVAVATGYAEGAKSKELKVVWKQVTDAIIKGSWRAITAKDDATFKAEVDDMIKNANAYDNGNGYKECVEWSVKEAERRHNMEEEVRAAEKGTN